MDLMVIYVLLFALIVISNAFEMDNLYVAFDDIQAMNFLASNLSTFKVVVAPSAIKHPGNPILIPDRPWEATLDNGYVNIVYNPDNTPKWQMWYACFLYYNDWKGINNSGTLYAESDDGITWTKPNLNIISINGSKANNAVCKDCHGWGVWRSTDKNDHGVYYKVFGALWEDGVTCNMKAGEDDCTVIGQSQDGIHWNTFLRPNITNRWDTHNIMFLDPKTSKYIGYTRSMTFPPRIIARTESTYTGSNANIVINNYTQITNTNQGITMNDQLHDQIAMPFHSVYIGFVTVFQTENPDQTTDCGMVWSLDTIEWFRLGAYHTNDANIIQRDVHSKDFDSHLCFAGAFPVNYNNEIRFYYSGANNTFFPGTGRQTSVGLATIRQDGWAGLTNKYHGHKALLMSHTMEVTGPLLTVTVDVYNMYNGSIRIGLTGNDNIQQNNTIDHCIPITKNVTDYIVQWEYGNNIEYLMNEKVNIQFEVNEGVLYTFGFLHY